MTCIGLLLIVQVTVVAEQCSRFRILARLQTLSLLDHVLFFEFALLLKSGETEGSRGVRREAGKLAEVVRIKMWDGRPVIARTLS